DRSLKRTERDRRDYRKYGSDRVIARARKQSVPIHFGSRSPKDQGRQKPTESSLFHVRPDNPAQPDDDELFDDPELHPYQTKHPETVSKQTRPEPLEPVVLWGNETCLLD